MGVGGVGVSALARLCKAEGAVVSGTDISNSLTVNKLKSEGFDILSESAVNVLNYDMVVHSNAVAETNQIIMKAKRGSIPVFKRGEVLAKIISNDKSIAVTGSHGKTTITFLLGSVLLTSHDANYLYGGGMESVTQTNYIMGEGSWIVAELDESDKTFLEASPKITIISNLDFEHVDEYKDFAEQKEVFCKYINNLSPDSVLIINGDDVELKNISEQNFKGKELICCGVHVSNNYQIKGFKNTDEGIEFDIIYAGHSWHMKLTLKGRHNAFNSLYAFVAALKTGVDPDQIISPLSCFKGVKRRMELLKELPGGGFLISDYGHHPTEISSVLDAYLERGKFVKLAVVFEGHRNSRVGFFLNEFSDALGKADKVVLVDLHTAYEKGDSESLLENIRNNLGSKCVRVSNDLVVSYIEKNFNNGEIVVIFSAGKIDSIIRKGFKIC